MENYSEVNDCNLLRSSWSAEERQYRRSVALLKQIELLELVGEATTVEPVPKTSSA